MKNISKALLTGLMVTAATGMVAMDDLRAQAQSVIAQLPEERVTLEREAAGAAGQFQDWVSEMELKTPAAQEIRTSIQQANERYGQALANIGTPRFYTRGKIDKRTDAGNNYLAEVVEIIKPNASNLMIETRLQLVPEDIRTHVREQIEEYLNRGR